MLRSSVRGSARSSVRSTLGAGGGALAQLKATLQASTVWAKLDALVLYVGRSRVDALKNTVSTNYEQSEVGTLTHHSERGFTGDGSTGYLNTGFNPSIGGTQFTANSNHTGVWMLNTRQANGGSSLFGLRDSGASQFIDATPRYQLSGADVGIFRQVAGAPGTWSVDNTAGHWVGVRESSTIHKGYKDGVLVLDESRAVTSVPNDIIAVLARKIAGGTADAFGADRAGVFHAGSALTAAEITVLYDALYVYMEQVGALKSDIIGWGDSLTAGDGGTGDTYLDVAADLFDPPRVTITRGVASQTSRNIAARQGGEPALFTATGNEIPASGAVSMTCATATEPLTNATSVTAFAAGIKGTLARASAGSYTFTRAASGSATPFSAGSPVYFYDAETYKYLTQWFWVGRNNFADATQVKSDIAAMVAYLPHSRFLVGGILPASTDSSGDLDAISALNLDLYNLYGSKFVNVLAALQAAGDGSANDNADIAAGLVPRSLVAATPHLNDAGYAVVAAAFVAANLANNW